MALIQWKQIDPRLLGNGQLSGSLEISGSITLNGQTITSFGDLSDGELSGGGIFEKTGSFYSTTNNTQFTGSLQIQLPSNKSFSVNNSQRSLFEVTDQGIVQIATQSVAPTAIKGGLYLDSTYNLFIGQE